MEECIRKNKCGDGAEASACEQTQFVIIVVLVLKRGICDNRCSCSEEKNRELISHSKFTSYERRSLLLHDKQGC